MSLRDILLDQITEQDINALMSTGVPESPLIDYKRDTYGNTEGDKREFLADISSFANTMGGDIIIGVDEANGLPAAITPFEGDADAEVRRPRKHGIDWNRTTSRACLQLTREQIGIGCRTFGVSGTGGIPESANI